MVSAIIKGFRIDARKIIWADVEYDIDGEIKINPYPMQKSNIVGLTAEQVADWLRVNIIFQANKYIEVKFKETNKEQAVASYIADADYYKNDYHSKTYIDGIIADDTEENLVNSVLNPLINTVHSSDKTPLIFGVLVDTGKKDAEEKPIMQFNLTNRIEARIDGTHIEKAI